MNNSRANWKRWSAAFLATLVFILVPWQSYAQSPAVGPTTGGSLPGLHLLNSDNESIVLELLVPAWQVRTQRFGDLELDKIEVPGFSYTSAPGTPQLPVRFVTLGIPPGVTPEVQVLQADGVRVEKGYRLAANPSRSLNFDLTPFPALATLNGPPAPKIEPATGSGFYPAEPARIVQEGWLRSQHVVQLRLNPFQYDPQQQTLRIYTHLRVAVKFDPPAPSPSSEPVDEGPFEPALRSLLFNYEAAKAWRRPRNALAQIEPQSFYTGQRFRIEVSREGLYQLQRTRLFVSGQTSQIYDNPLSTFQLFEGFNLSPEREVALEVVDVDGDDRLDFDDAIRFYGRGADEEELRYTDTRVYWLVAGREAGKRMAARGAPPGAGPIAPDFPATVHAEENHIYWSNLPNLGGSDSHWYWEFVNHADRSAPRDLSYTVSTPGRSSSDNITFRAKLVGYSQHEVNPDHWTKFYLNDNFVASALWDGQVGLEFEVAGISPSYLTAGANTVRVEEYVLPEIPENRSDALFVDWFEIDYRQTFVAQSNRLIFSRPEGYSQYRITGFSSSAIGVYDITDPRQPVRLKGTDNSSGSVRFGDAAASAQRYLAVDLQTSAVLTPDKVEHVPAGDDLRASTNAAEYLIITPSGFTSAANRLRDHRAADFVAKVVQVQDIYNQFGNGVLDPDAIHGFLVYAYHNWSSNLQYVTLLGDGTHDYRNYKGTSPHNYIPPYQGEGIDPWLGETADENHYASVSGSDFIPDLFVGRLPVNSLAEANAVVDKIISYDAGTTRPGDTILLVADNADSAGDFAAQSDTIADSTVPGSYTRSRVFLGVNYSTASAAKSAIITNINQGRRFVNYTGHSGIPIWADENLFASSDVNSLSNTNAYPVVLGMTCLEGSFHDFESNAVAESLLRATNKGAIASWSATGLGVATGHDVLNAGFYSALFRDGVGRLGPAIVAAKIRLYSTGTNLDLIHTFALLGDPATDTGIEAVCTAPRADVTDDGIVNVADLAELSPFWRQSQGAPYDQDDNNFIDVRDFMLVATAWGSGCGG